MDGQGTPLLFLRSQVYIYLYGKGAKELKKMMYPKLSYTPNT
jgi:hypothetical protein